MTDDNTGQPKPEPPVRETPCGAHPTGPLLACEYSPEMREWGCATCKVGDPFDLPIAPDWRI